MEQNNNYNEEIYNALKEVNISIINSYKMRKDFYFLFCTKNNGGFGNYWTSYLGEFSIINKLFRFKYRLFKYGSDMNEAESFFIKNGFSKNVNQIGIYSKDIINLTVAEGRKTIESRVRTKNARFGSLDDFANHLSADYENIENSEEIIKTYSSIPNELLKAYKKYSDCREAKNEKIISNISRNLQNYKDSINYAEIYENNPETFLEIVRSLPDKEKEKALGQVIKGTEFQKHKKVDDEISKEFEAVIDAAGRKGI